MITSLTDLCSRMNGTISLVVQGDRRQTPDRRKARRGGRRVDDVNQATDSLDMRSVAIRRTLIGPHFPSIAAPDDPSHGDARVRAVARPADSMARRLTIACGQRTPK